MNQERKLHRNQKQAFQETGGYNITSVESNHVYQIFCIAIVLFGALASFFKATVASGSELKLYLGVVLGLGIATVYELMRAKLSKKGYWASVLGILLVGGLLYSILSNGAAISYNVFSLLAGETYGVNLKQWVINQSTATVSQIVFITYSSLLFSILMVSLGKIDRIWSKVLFCILLVLVGYSFVIAKIIPVHLWNGLELVGLLIYFLPNHKAKHWIRNHGFELAVFAVVVILFGIAMDAREDANALAAKTKVIRNWEKMVYGAPTSPEGVVADGERYVYSEQGANDKVQADDANHKGSAQRKSKPQDRLQVTLSEPTELHLRSFVGAAYEGKGTNGVWKPLAPSQYAGHYLEMFDWLKEHNYQVLAAAGTYGSVKSVYKEETVEPIQVSVNNIGACRKYTYVSDNILPDSIKQFEKCKRDEYIGQPWSKQENSYSFAIYPWTANDLIKENAEQFLQENGEGDAVLEPYYNGEINYRKFAYEKYLEIPKSAVKYVNQFTVSPSGDFLSKVNQVRGCLEQMDKQDTCSYASIGALLFRSVGVPARYVEGYYISEDMGTTVTVTNEDLHAWVECYQDGIGWISVEVTPGYYDDLNENHHNQNQTEDDELDEPDEIDDTYESVTEERDYTWLIILGISLIIVAILVLIVLRIRHYVLWNHKDDAVRFNYYAKLVKRLLKKQHKIEQELPEELWQMLQAHAFGGQELTKTQVNSMATYILEQKRRKRNEAKDD